MRPQAWVVVAFALLSTPAMAETLSAVLIRADHQMYREVPLRVPEGVRMLDMAFRYTGQNRRSVIDLGLP